MSGLDDAQQPNGRYRGLPGAADDASTMSQSDYGDAVLPSAGPSGIDGASTSQHTLSSAEPLLTSTPTPKRPVKLKPLRKILDNALNQLQRRDLYLFFAQPVKKSEVPDYYEHIKEPMDFGSMQTKLESGQYKTLDQFRRDFLLVTRNAQYYNVIDGPSAIVHTEAKKLEDWGLKLLAREEPAVEETAPKPVPAKPASPAPGRSSDSPAPAKKAGRISIKLKKQPSISMQSSTNATPRPATPSRLQNEIKMEIDDGDSSLVKRDLGIDDDLDKENRSFEARQRNERSQVEEEDSEEEEEDEEDDSEDDDDEGSSDDDDDDESSARGASMSVDGGTGAPKRRRRWRRVANKKKQQLRQSVIAALVTRTAKDKKDTPEIAHISSTSEIIAAQIPRDYCTDGALDMSKLLDDERIALLRTAGIDTSPDVLAPFVDALMPIHPDLVTNATSHLRELRDIVDGFGAALKEKPFDQEETQTYNIPKDKTPDQQKYPFSLSAGWIFQNLAADVPMAWPRLAPTPGLSQSTDPQPQHGGGPLRRKDRDAAREREEVGLLNLDDWTYPRPSQARLVEARDMGIYPGLLPAAWVQHIAYQKGGPSFSRLPPLYLAIGPAFENAILDELASLPNRVLLDAKPGIMSSTNAFPAPSPQDVATAIELASERGWDLNGEEARKAGARGCDVLREAVYGGALGEAYAASVDDFVRGATISAEEAYEAEKVAIAERARDDQVKASETIVAAPADPEQTAPQSYFDENGDMYNVEAYIGVDLIPLEVRKEAGMVAQTGVGSNFPTERATPVPAQTPPAEEPISYKRMRTTSRYIPNKRRLTETLEMGLRSDASSTVADTPADAETPGEAENDAEVAEREAEKRAEEEERERRRKYRFAPDDEHSAFLRGSILDRSLYEHVKCSLIDPLSGGLLQLLDLVWEGIVAPAPKSTGQNVFSLELSILDEVADLVKSASVKTEEGKPLLLEEDKAPRLPFVPPPEFKAQLIELVQKLHKREYYKAKSKLLELSRAQHSSIQLDGLVRTRDDLIRPEVEKPGASHASALLFDDMCAPFDTQRAHTILSDAAIEVVALSDALNASKGEEQPPMTDQERLDKLRVAYVTLVHHMPQRDIRKGHWPARLEAMRKDDMRSLQSGVRGGSRPVPSSRPSQSNGSNQVNGTGFPMASPGTPGAASTAAAAPSPLDKISHVNSARLDISKLGAHPSLLASLNAMKKSPQPQSQSQESSKEIAGSGGEVTPNGNAASASSSQSGQLEAIVPAKDVTEGKAHAHAAAINVEMKVEDADVADTQPDTDANSVQGVSESA